VEDNVYDVLDLKALRCFWATAKHGSLTRAGIELGISEAAVSQRVKSLEAYLTTKLYEARGGRVRLTPAGQRTMELATGLFEQLEDFRHTVGRAEARGRLTLSTHEPILVRLLPAVVQRFVGDQPRARLRLLSRQPRETVELVRVNEADLGIVAERALPDGLVFHPWKTFGAYVLVPRGHPLVRRGVPAFRDLLNEATATRYPLIMPEIEDLEHQRVATALRREGLPFSVGLEVGTVETVTHYVARGLGIAVVPGICVSDQDRASIAAIPIPSEFGGATTYGAILRRDKHLTGPLRALLVLLGVRAGPGRT
jgi:DNA-binding transcriptional LysR family regulator